MSDRQHDYLVEVYYPPYPSHGFFIHARRLSGNELDYSDSLSPDAVRFGVVQARRIMEARRRFANLYFPHMTLTIVKGW